MRHTTLWRVSEILREVRKSRRRLIHKVLSCFKKLEKTQIALRDEADSLSIETTGAKESYRVRLRGDGTVIWIDLVVIFLMGYIVNFRETIKKKTQI